MAKSQNAQNSTGLQNATLESLASIARHSNLLAHLLDGSFRSDLFSLKSEACSLLLIKNWAVVNCIRGGVVGLTICTEIPVRVHVPISALWPRARTLVRESTGAPATASIAEFLAGRRN
jgi:hypothetical protein